MNEDIRELLTRGASDAVDTDLVSGVWQQAHRRRQRRHLGIGSLAAAGVALVIGLTQIGGGKETTLPADTTAATATESASAPATPALPDGWRWESFGGVQVGVPGDWGWGSPSQRVNQWCLFDEADLAQPLVGQAGISTAVGCDVHRGATLPPKDMLVEHTGELVMFDWTTEPDARPLDAGDRTTVRLQGVSVIVQTQQPLRDQIAATIHTVDTDARGCPATHPITADSTWRPGGAALDDLEEVSSVSICRFTLRDSMPEIPEELTGSLMSSWRIDGPDAQQAIETIAQAPIGGGPNRPGQCAADIAFGEEAIVLLVTTASGTSEVVARYAGCDHHGFDDGHVIRTLTAEALAPLVEGPNLPGSLSSEVGDLVYSQVQD